MYWPILFSEKYRVISGCVFSLLLFFTLELGMYMARMRWEEERNLAKEELGKSLEQYQQRQAAWRIWQKEKSNLQKGRIYIGTEKSGGLKFFLKQWQSTHPHRKIHFTVETIVSPSRWHQMMSRQVFRLSLRFSVQNEIDLLKVWQEKKAFPCLQIPENITFRRTENGEVEIEEQLICVQF